MLFQDQVEVVDVKERTIWNLTALPTEQWSVSHGRLQSFSCCMFSRVDL